MDFPNDAHVRRIHRHLIGLKSFKSYIDKLEQQFCDIDNVKSLILANKRVFWTAQLGRNKFEVRPKTNAKLCWKYNYNSCDDECGQLHLCKVFLISPSSCSTPCKHGLSHNIGDKHNKISLKNVFPKNTSHWIKIKLLRSSFPRLCKAFIEQGSCEKVFCGYFHICADYANGNCPTGSCNQESLSGLSKSVVHDFRREHNTKVRNLFNFSIEYNRDEILGSILLPLKEFQEDVCYDDISDCSNANSVSSEDVNDLESVSSVSSSVHFVSPPKKVKSKLCYYYLKNCCRNERCPRLHMCKEFLINGNKCSKECRYGLSHNPYDEHNKLVVEADTGMNEGEIVRHKMLEIIRKSFPRVCKDYEEKICLTGGRCDRLHICNQTLLDTVCTKNGCMKSHNLEDDHNSMVLQSYFITMQGNKITNILTNIMISNTDQLIVDRDIYSMKSSQQDLSRSVLNISTNSSIVRSLSMDSKSDVFPDKLKLKICYHYINGNCGNAKCPRLHMCKDFLVSENKCKEICQHGLSHDPLDDHNGSIIKKENVDIPKKSKVLHVLRNSFPRVCMNYMNGNCITVQCGRMHVCKNVLENRTCTNMECNLSHDIQDEHNLKILKIYSLDVSAMKKLNFNFVLANVLYLPNSEQFNVKLCHGYSDGSCLNFACPYLHLCKEYLVDDENCNEDCLESHDLFDTHNKRIISNYCTTIPDSKVLEMVRNSFPKFCENYNSGNCSSNKCDKIHICIMALHDKTCHDDECFKSHDLCDTHNSNVFKTFLFKDGDISNRDFLIANILVSIEYLQSALSIATEYKWFLFEHETGKFNDFRQNIKKHYSLDRYRLVRDQENGAYTVTICPTELKPCFYYWSKKSGCSSEKCDMVHICRSFLHSSNHISRTCEKNHSFQSEHNQKVLRKSKLQSLSTDQILLILRLRYPRVCEAYIEGRCTFGEDCCPDVHVCSEFMMGRCKDDCTLLLNHEKALKDGHAKELMKMFHISQKNLRNCIILPQPKSKPTRRMRNVRRKSIGREVPPARNIYEGASVNDVHELKSPTIQNYHFEPMSFTSTFKSDEEQKKEAIEISCRNVNNDVFNVSPSPALKTTLDLSSLKNFPNATNTLFVEPSEIDVFKFIFQDQGGTYSLARSLVEESNGLFGNVDFRADSIKVNEMICSWFEKHASTFRIVKENNKRIKSLYGDRFYLCVDTIAPCYEYWLDKCIYKTCDKFHFCKEFLHDIQHSAVSCRYNHSFKDAYAQYLITKNNLQPLSEKQLKLLLKLRYPLVCIDYLSASGCSQPENVCQYVHICGDYINGKCTKPNGLCNHSHELTGIQAMRLMKEFHITSPDQFKKCIIYWKDDPKHSWNYQSRHKALKADFDWLTNEAICYKYMIGDCDSCNIFHLDTGLPYSWQYYENESWNMFNSRLNQEIEKTFCDPNNDSFDSLKVDSTQPKRLIIYQGYKWKTALFGNRLLNIRRLSTAPSVHVKDKQAVGVTEWKWYWKNGIHWDEYTKWTTSDSIEKAFLKAPKGSFTFATDEFKYTLSFDSMQQQNMDPTYSTRRDVKRRPAYKTKKDLRNVTQVIAAQNLPWYWPIADASLSLTGGRIDVDFATRQKIENSFITSMNRAVRVLDVEEVCNTQFYESYESKKRSMKAKVGSHGVNEMSLYHGTDHSVVDGICAQNFDWRLCGKNATVYGQGSYFAKSASYSHNYTTADTNNRRYMFVAQVLAGRYTVGDSSMKRPPAVDPTVDAHDLYDSCVNNQNNPTLYVIFERDQCYPRYLITYTDSVSPIYVPKKRPQPLTTPPAKPSSNHSANNASNSNNNNNNNNNSSSNNNKNNDSQNKPCVIS